MKVRRDIRITEHEILAIHQRIGVRALRRLSISASVCSAVASQLLKLVFGP